MSSTSPPSEICNLKFDGESPEIGPGGVSLSSCDLCNLPWERCVFPVFFARGCIFESCDFHRARLESGYFGGGEGAGFSQTIYRDCNFDQATLDGMSFGSARFERCSLRDVRLAKWLSFSAEFVDCVFAGDIPEAAFLGCSPLHNMSRRHNEFRGNDFSQAKFGRVEFRGGINLELQQLPRSEGDSVIDRRSERLAHTLAEIESWPDEAERRSAQSYLGLYGGSRYDGQEQLFIQNRPSRLIGEPLRRRVIKLLLSCPPEKPD